KRRAGIKWSIRAWQHECTTLIGLRQPLARKVMRITHVVHPMTVRPEPRAPDGRLPASSNDGLRTESSIPNRYVLIADPLIAAFAHAPLAVGVYVAIARLTLAAKDAVSLAAHDPVACIGSDRDPDRAANMRRNLQLE